MNIIPKQYVENYKLRQLYESVHKPRFYLYIIKSYYNKTIYDTVYEIEYGVENNDDIFITKINYVYDDMMKLYNILKLYEYKMPRKYFYGNNTQTTIDYRTKIFNDILTHLTKNNNININDLNYLLKC